MNSAKSSVNTESDSIKSKTQRIYDYVQQYPIQSGVVGGAFLYLTGRYVYHKLYQWYYKLPPGPFSAIPFIGHILTSIMNPKWHIVWAIHYGQAFTFYQMNKISIMINDAAIAKQILSKSYAQDHDVFVKTQKNENILICSLLKIIHRHLLH